MKFKIHPKEQFYLRLMVIISTLTYVSLAFPAIMMIRYVLSNI